jgi:hypothetical protein
MADGGTISAGAAVAPAPKLTPQDSPGRTEKLLSKWAFCCEPRSFACTRRLPFAYQQLMHKNCGQPHSTRLKLIQRLAAFRLVAKPTDVFVSHDIPLREKYLWCYQR